MQCVCLQQQQHKVHSSFSGSIPIVCICVYLVFPHHAHVFRAFARTNFNGKRMDFKWYRTFIMHTIKRRWRKPTMQWKCNHWADLLLITNFAVIVHRVKSIFSITHDCWIAKAKTMPIRKMMLDCFHFH